MIIRIVRYNGIFLLSCQKLYISLQASLLQSSLITPFVETDLKFQNVNHFLFHLISRLCVYKAFTLFVLAKKMSRFRKHLKRGVATPCWWSLLAYFVERVSSLRLNPRPTSPHNEVIVRLQATPRMQVLIIELGSRGRCTPRARSAAHLRKVEVAEGKRDSFLHAMWVVLV